MTASTIPHYKLAEMAERVGNAYIDFSSTVMDIAGCSETEARRVTRFYLDEKLASVDTAIGRITVKHGALMQADVIQACIDQTSAEQGA